MFNLEIFLSGLSASILLALLTWSVSFLKGDVSIVDSMWSLFFLALGATYFLLFEYTTMRSIIVITLVSLWAIRLSAYITWRNWGEGEDYRYLEMRQKYSPNFALKSLFIVFLLQAILAWIISLPLLAAITGSKPLHLIDGAAIALVLFGILFEAIADKQLANFKSQPSSHGKVMDKGLWHFTRHPNYFGECCVWWGFYLFALAAGGWWAIIAPLLMTFLLLRVSGVALLEKDITERRPEYDAYIRRTNAFIPGLPRTENKSVTQQ